MRILVAFLRDYVRTILSFSFEDKILRRIKMALAVLLADELSSKLERLSEKLNRSMESLVVEAIQKMVVQHKDIEDLVAVVRLQYKTPFRVP